MLVTNDTFQLPFGGLKYSANRKMKSMSITLDTFPARERLIERGKVRASASNHIEAHFCLDPPTTVNLSLFASYEIAMDLFAFGH
jgi:hypothetical protein